MPPLCCARANLGFLLLINMKKILLTLVLFSALLARGAGYSGFEAVQTIQSGFVMEKHLSIAARPLVSKGKFYFERPGFLRWEYTSPFPSGIMLDGKKAFSWSAGKVKDVSSEPFAAVMARQIYMFVSMDLAKISAAYNTEEKDNVLTLTPKDASSAQAVAAIKLFINDARNALTKVEMHEKRGDKTIINFTGVVLDAPIPAAVKTPYDEEK